MDINIKVRENGYISWLKNMYEQFNGKKSFNEDDRFVQRIVRVYKPRRW